MGTEENPPKNDGRCVDRISARRGTARTGRAPFTVHESLPGLCNLKMTSGTATAVSSVMR